MSVSHTHAHTPTHTNTHAHTHTHTHTHTQPSHTFMHTLTHPHTHAHPHTPTRTWVQTSWSPPAPSCSVDAPPQTVACPHQTSSSSLAALVVAASGPPPSAPYADSTVKEGVCVCVCGGGGGREGRGCVWRVILVCTFHVNCICAGRQYIHPNAYSSSLTGSGFRG